MEAYKEAIEEILKFKKAFDNIKLEIPKVLVGEIGEFYVLYKLHKLGYKKLLRKGGQAGFDIYIEDNNKKIEVRTSLPKNEGLYPNKEVQFFGWRVKNQNQEIKFDIMVGVALDRTFRKPEFFIFTRKQASSIGDVDIGRFNKMQKKIHLFVSEDAYKEAIKSRPKYVTKYERYINKNPDKFLNKWNKINEPQ